MQVCRYSDSGGDFRIGLVTTEATDGAERRRTLWSAALDGGWDQLLRGELDPEALERLAPGAAFDPAPPLLAPLLPATEIWEVGLNYFRAGVMRAAGSAAAPFYDLAYAGPRPDLQFKVVGRRAAGPGDPLRLRRGSSAVVAAPHVGLLLSACLRPIGCVLCADLTARDLERENPLYLSMSKVFEGSCGVGGLVTPFRLVEQPLRVRFRVQRGDEVVFRDEMTTDKMRRSIDDLIGALREVGPFPEGVLLLTGSSSCPPEGFSLAEGDHVRIRAKQLGRFDQLVAEPGPAP